MAGTISTEQALIYTMVTMSGVEGRINTTELAQIGHIVKNLPADEPDSRERSDKEFTNTVRAEMPLPWFVKNQALFVTGEYTNKVVDSNINAFSYRRNYAAIYFTWQY